MLLRFLKPLVIIGCTIGSTAAFAADDASQQPQAAPQQTAPTPSGGAASGKTPKATAESTEKGQLKNPYQDFAKVADEATRNSWPRADCYGAQTSPTQSPELSRTSRLTAVAEAHETALSSVDPGHGIGRSLDFAKQGRQRTASCRRKRRAMRRTLRPRRRGLHPWLYRRARDVDERSSLLACLAGRRQRSQRQA